MAKKFSKSRALALAQPSPDDLGRENYLELTDEQLALFTERLNSTIHELVFAIQHMDQGDIEDTQNCLVTAQSTIERVADEYESLRKAKQTLKNYEQHITGRN